MNRYREQKMMEEDANHDRVNVFGLSVEGRIKEWHIERIMYGREVKKEKRSESIEY